MKNNTLIYVLALLTTGALIGLVFWFVRCRQLFYNGSYSVLVLTAMGIDPTITIRVSFGTNLLVVFPTALSDSFRHHKKG